MHALVVVLVEIEAVVTIKRARQKSAKRLALLSHIIALGRALDLHLQRSTLSPTSKPSFI